ncbi:tetratricopeptide repeat protein [Kitasatospora aureofaciens]|uniref:tetratricopeptide repeat protein n=1 Tax=Kitasatospora aureofaciens TaxID=1894 RepID=UPI0037C6077C
MDADDLDYRARTRSECVPPELVARLLERGHAAVVGELAGGGEWFCAREWARLLGEWGRQAEALDVLAPYLATGWWTATETAAGLLEDWGRAREAIELTHTRMLLGHPHALESYTRLLARHGRAREAFDLLLPHVDDDSLARVLVDISGVAGRDEETATLLAARIPADHRCDGPWCCRGRLDPDTAIGLLATVRERQGRVDEAIALLRITSVNSCGRLAGLLARHDRIEELRAYAMTKHHGDAVRRLAELLEERGDVEGAVAVYRQAGAASDSGNVAVRLAELLARHGRGEEAIEVMRAKADAPGGAVDWILDRLCTLYADQGRPQDALDYLDGLKARRGGGMGTVLDPPPADGRLWPRRRSCPADPGPSRGRHLVRGRAPRRDAGRRRTHRGGRRRPRPAHPCPPPRPGRLPHRPRPHRRRRGPPSAARPPAEPFPGHLA